MLLTMAIGSRFPTTLILKEIWTRVHTCRRFDSALVYPVPVEIGISSDQCVQNILHIMDKMDEDSFSHPILSGVDRIAPHECIISLYPALDTDEGVDALETSMELRERILKAVTSGWNMCSLVVLLEEKSPLSVDEKHEMLLSFHSELARLDGYLSGAIKRRRDLRGATPVEETVHESTSVFNMPDLPDLSDTPETFRPTASQIIEAISAEERKRRAAVEDGPHAYAHIKNVHDVVLDIKTKVKRFIDQMDHIEEITEEKKAELLSYVQTLVCFF
jgi:hypothetical protein